jgi:outer membrane receptor protein involved in Fe transport
MKTIKTRAVEKRAPGSEVQKMRAPGTIVDFDISYELKRVMGAKSVELRLTATNLFNQEDISTINTAATYQTGRPFGVYANIDFKF